MTGDDKLHRFAGFCVFTLAHLLEDRKEGDIQLIWTDNGRNNTPLMIFFYCIFYSFFTRIQALVCRFRLENRYLVYLQIHVQKIPVI